ncbi:MAG: DNA mismatch repair endonuclease MutL, partial [Pseudomonadota bacterium]
MSALDRNIEGPNPIRRLSDAAANRIAAGEVIERPASAVKELVENALDAGATRIDVTIADGGKSLIRVEDNGTGIPRDQLALALERHATSKIDGSDLINIASFGFRGEALPSIGSVARMSVTSNAGEGAWQIEVRGGEIGEARPAARGAGTTVEVRDLFSATPARLKFLRTDRAETQAIQDALRRLALAEPSTGLTLRDATGGGEGRQLLSLPALLGDEDKARRQRIRDLVGKPFLENAIKIDTSREEIHLSGYAGLP